MHRQGRGWEQATISVGLISFMLVLTSDIIHFVNTRSKDNNRAGEFWIFMVTYEVKDFVENIGVNRKVAGLCGDELMGCQCMRMEHGKWSFQNIY